MVVAIKNEMEQFFPLGLSKMLKNNCTHSYRPILLIEKFLLIENFSITTNGLLPLRQFATKFSLEWKTLDLTAVKCLS